MAASRHWACKVLLIVAVSATCGAIDVEQPSPLGVLDTSLFDAEEESGNPSSEDGNVGSSLPPVAPFNPWMNTIRALLANQANHRQGQQQQRHDETGVNGRIGIQSTLLLDNLPTTLTAEKLIAERSATPQGLFPDVFQVDTTAVPASLVTPTKFEDLLSPPIINFRSSTGSQSQAQKKPKAGNSGSNSKKKGKKKKKKKNEEERNKNKSPTTSRPKKKKKKPQRQRVRPIPFTRLDNSNSPASNPFAVDPDSTPAGPTRMDLAREEIRATLATPKSFENVFLDTTTLKSDGGEKRRPSKEQRAGKVIATTFTPFQIQTGGPTRRPSSPPPPPTLLDEARDSIRNSQQLRATPNLVSLRPELNPFSNEATRPSSSSSTETATTSTFRTAGPLEQVREQIRQSLTTQKISNIQGKLFNPFAPTTQSPAEDPTTTTPNPMATARNRIREMLAAQLTATEPPPVSSTAPVTVEEVLLTTTTTPAPPATTTESMMAQARERLRTLINQKQVDMVEQEKVTGEEKQQQLLEMLKNQRKMQIALQRVQEDAPLITVTVRGNTGAGGKTDLADMPDLDVNAMSVPSPTRRPSITLEPLSLTTTMATPTFAPDSDVESFFVPGAETTTASPLLFDVLSTVSPTRQQVIDLIEATEAVTLGTQDVLQRLTDSEGDVDTELPAVLDTTTAFEVRTEDTPFTLAPTELPIATTTPSPTTTPAPTPRRKTFSNFKPKKSRNDPLKRLRPHAKTSPLVPRRKQFSDFKPPSRKQNPLLKPLRSKDESSSSEPRRTFSDFKPPSRRGNPLLRRLRPGYTGKYQGLRVPTTTATTTTTEAPTTQGPDVEVFLPAGDENAIIKNQPLTLQSPETLNDLDQLEPFRKELLAEEQLEIQPAVPEDDVGLEVPSRRQNILLRQLQAGNKGIVANILPPTEAQGRDPLLRPLQSGDSGNAEGLTTPNVRQNPLLRGLTEGDTGLAQGLVTPSTRQNPLLKLLQDRPVSLHKNLLKTPAEKQNPLLRPLQGGHTGDVSGLEVPNDRQNPLLQTLEANNSGRSQKLILPSQQQDPLLRPLQSGENGIVEGLNVPGIKQNILLRQLQAGQSGSNDKLQLPTNKQNPLLRPLQSGHTGQVEGLNAPSLKQSTLLRPLTGGFTGSDHTLRLPSDKQNPLLRPLQEGHTGQVAGLNPPSIRQNTLLRQLTSSYTGSNHNIDLPSSKQNPLLRLLQSGHTGEVEGLEVPTLKQSTLLRQLQAGHTSSEDDLEVPSTKQNPLLSPLQEGHSGHFEGLDAPSIKQSQLLQTLQSGQSGEEHELEVPSFKQSPLLQPLQDGHTGEVEGLDIPSLRQNTLLRPLQGGQTAADVELIVPSLKQDTLLLPLQASQGGNINGLEAPSQKQSPLLQPLVEDHDGTFPGLDTPTIKQNPLLRPLQSGHTASDHDLRVPSEKQNPLLRPLQNGHSGTFPGLEVPSDRQNTLLRQLQAGQTASHHNLRVPSQKQSPLLGQLLRGDSGRVEGLGLPGLRQNTLLRPLQAGHTSSELDISAPSVKQSPLLGQLQEGHSGDFEGLNAPNLKQSNLLRPLQAGHTSSEDELDVPSLKQNTLLRPLTSGHSGIFPGLDAPGVGQDPLLRPLQAGHSFSDHDLEAPPEKQNPLLRPLQGGHVGAAQGLSLPNVKLNPLLRILRLSRRDKMKSPDEQDLDFNSVEIFRNLMANPGSYADDFAQLPRKMKANLLRIVDEETGGNFDFEALTAKTGLVLDTLDPEGEIAELAPIPAFVTSAPDIIDETFSSVFPTAFPPMVATTIAADAEEEPEVTTKRFRLRLPPKPPGAAEVVRIERPQVEEVTFERVVATTTAAGTTNGIVEDVTQFPVRTSTASELPTTTAESSENLTERLKTAVTDLKDVGLAMGMSNEEALQFVEAITERVNATQANGEKVQKEAVMNSLLPLIIRNNAERAKEAFESRKPETNAFEQESDALKQKLQGAPKSVVRLTDLQRQQAERNQALQRMPEKEEFTNAFLVNKIRDHDGPRPPSSEHNLEAPLGPSTTTTTTTEEATTITVTPASNPFLINKIRDHNGPRLNSNSHALEPPSPVRDGPNSRTPKAESTLRRPLDVSNVVVASVPRSTTTTTTTTAEAVPVSTAPPPTESFTEALRTITEKTVMEDEIMSMLLQHPDTAAQALSGLFDHETVEEKQVQEQELSSLIEKNPLAVTVAFTDLMFAGPNDILKTEEEDDEELFTPKVPHHYHDPPEAVKGQLLRLTSPQPTALPAVEEKLPANVLDSMMQLIESGHVEPEEIIEEMTSQGVLNKDGYGTKTTAAALPTRGKEKSKSEIVAMLQEQVSEQADLAQRQRQPLPEKLQKEQDHREVMSQQRAQKLKEMRNRNPVVAKDKLRLRPNSAAVTMTEVGLGDPSQDVEVVKAEQDEEGRGEKEIDASKSMMNLYKMGIINKAELEEIMDLLGQEVEEADDQHSGDEGSKPVPGHKNQANGRPRYPHGNYNSSTSFSYFNMNFDGKEVARPAHLARPPTSRPYKKPPASYVHMHMGSARPRPPHRPRPTETPLYLQEPAYPVTKAPTVPEFSHAHTEEELKDSFEEIFKNYESFEANGDIAPPVEEPVYYAQKLRPRPTRPHHPEPAPTGPALHHPKPHAPANLFVEAPPEPLNHFQPQLPRPRPTAMPIKPLTSHDFEGYAYESLKDVPGPHPHVDVLSDPRPTYDPHPHHHHSYEEHSYEILKQPHSSYYYKDYEAYSQHETEPSYGHYAPSPPPPPPPPPAPTPAYDVNVNEHHSDYVQTEYDLTRPPQLRLPEHLFHFDEMSHAAFRPDRRPKAPQPPFAPPAHLLSKKPKGLHEEQFQFPQQVSFKVYGLPASTSSSGSSSAAWRRDDESNNQPVPNTSHFGYSEMDQNIQNIRRSFLTGYTEEQQR